MLVAFGVLFAGACASVEKNKEKEGLHGYGYHKALKGVSGKNAASEELWTLLSAQAIEKFHPSRTR